MIQRDYLKIDLDLKVMKQNALRWAVELLGIFVGLMVLDGGFFCVLITGTYALWEGFLLFVPFDVQTFRKAWIPAVFFLAEFVVGSIVEPHF